MIPFSKKLQDFITILNEFGYNNIFVVTTEHDILDIWLYTTLDEYNPGNHIYNYRLTGVLITDLFVEFNTLIDNRNQGIINKIEKKTVFVVEFPYGLQYVKINDCRPVGQ